MNQQLERLGPESREIMEQRYLYKVEKVRSSHRRVIYALVAIIITLTVFSINASMNTWKNESINSSISQVYIDIYKTQTSNGDNNEPVNKQVSASMDTSVSEAGGSSSNKPINVPDNTTINEAVSTQVDQQGEEQTGQPINVPVMNETLYEDQINEIVTPITVIKQIKIPVNVEDEYVFDYPTVGIPIPGQRYNSTPVAPEDMQIYDNEFNELLKPYNDTNCVIGRIGDEDLGQLNGNDGGYLICQNLLSDIEGVVNLGINGFDNFGCAVSSIKKIPNHQFDCTCPKQPVCTTNGDNNNFNLICISTYSKKKEDKQFLNLMDIIRTRNLTHKYIFLKTDTEGAEWDTLKHLPLEYLDYFDQIAFEIHVGDIYPEQWGQLDILRTLNTKFININYHMNNNACTVGRKLPAMAIEATLVNRRLIKFNSESRTYKLHPLNLINHFYKPDCQMNQEQG